MKANSVLKVAWKIDVLLPMMYNITLLIYLLNWINLDFVICNDKITFEIKCLRNSSNLILR